MGVFFGGRIMSQYQSGRFYSSLANYSTHYISPAVFGEDKSASFGTPEKFIPGNFNLNLTYAFAIMLLLIKAFIFYLLQF